MRPKSLILLGLALGCGLAASVGISQIMDANANRPATHLDTTPIYVALHNINLGDPIQASMISLQEWPSKTIPKGAITSIADLEGRRPRTTIFAGTPVIEEQLLAQGEVNDAIANIPPGYRLSTISVDAERGAAGLLKPGDRVDVQLFVEAGTQNQIQSAMTKVILQNIRIFAVEQTVQRSAEEDETSRIPETISLLVKPAQASKLNLAQNLGEISLIPRNPNDEVAASLPEVSISDLLGGATQSNNRVEEQVRSEQAKGPGIMGTLMGMMQQANQSSKKPEQPPFQMEIVKAEEVTSMLFDSETGKPLPDGQSTFGGVRNSVVAQSASFTKPTPAEEETNEQEEQEEAAFPIEF